MSASLPDERRSPMNAQSGHGWHSARHDNSRSIFFFIRRSSMASNTPGSPSSKGSSNRGFASMDPQRQREIASEGGRAAHEKGTAHEFTSEEARAAGRKGGQARSQSNRNRSMSASNNSDNMSSNSSGGSDSSR
jgi:general stress protein YciG